jgi:hypothetical protein
VWDEEVGQDNGVENKLWYFRENVFLSSHHFFWHLNTDQKTIPDRLGENFWLMHHEFVAR